MPERRTASRMAMAPRSAALMEESPPPTRPTGVRAMETITAFLMLNDQSFLLRREPSQEAPTQQAVNQVRAARRRRAARSSLPEGSGRKCWDQMALMWFFMVPMCSM